MSSFVDPVKRAAFAVHENKGVFALLLGSGISRAAEIPTGWEITLDLIRRVAEANGVNDEQDWAKWYAETEGKEPDYSDLLAKLAVTQSERRAILHGYIEPNNTDKDEGRKVPTDAHKAIAKLVLSGHIRVIITINFDRLIENALRDEGIEPTIVDSIDALKGAEPLAHTSCYVFKIHGDYKDSRIRNTEEELSDYPLEYKNLLDRIFDEYGLIICGWSAEWDHGLREAIQRAPNRRYPLFWASRSSLTGKAKDLLDFRNRQAIQIPIQSANTFFTELHEQVQALEATRSQNPLSIEMLLGRAKKYLAKSEYRIQLADLIENETKRVIEFLEQENKLKMDCSIGGEEFRQYIAACENASEGLVKLCGLVGRWGNDEHLLFVVNAIKKFIEYANSLYLQPHGTTMKIRKYPAVLMFQACMLGLVETEKWNKVSFLLLKKIDNHDKERPLACQSLCLRCFYTGMDFRLWPVLPWHLHDKIFSNWAHAFLSDMSDLIRYFILLEVLSDFLICLKDGKNMLTSPFLGLAEKLECQSHKDEVFSHLQDRNLLQRLADSGFGDRDPTNLITFVNSYEQIIAIRKEQRMRIGYIT